MGNRPGIPPSPEQLADRQAIRDVLSSHSRGLDRLDGDILRACYWPNAEVDYGAYRGPATQFIELVIPALEESYECTRHCLANSLVELRDDVAMVESYVNAAHLLNGSAAEMLFDGRYLDRLEKRDGEWRLLHRQVVIDWCRTHQIVNESGSDAFADLSRGSHGRDDPSYALLDGPSGQ